MGDETKINELEHGNRDLLGGPRKPSSAVSVDPEPAQVVQPPASKADPEPPDPRKER
jgi:hypothetical protein